MNQLNSKLSFLLLFLLLGACKENDPEPQPQPQPTPVEKYEIKTAEQFVTYLKEKAGDSKLSYSVVDDIDVSGLQLPSVSCLAGALDGRGHTISGLNSNRPLLDTLKGTLRDIKFKGKVTSSSGDLAAVAKVNRGVMSDVHSYVTVTLNSGKEMTSSSVVGGLVVYNIGTIEGSRNYGHVSVVSSAAVKGLAVGGFAGYSTGTFKNCKNEGGISIEAPYASGKSPIASVSSAAASLGGIVGLAQAGFSADNCENNGKLVYSMTAINKQTVSYERCQIGGIAGSPCGLVSSCRNSGAIDVRCKTASGTALTSPSHLVCVGGIAGGEYYSPSQNVTSIRKSGNTGDITVDTDYSGSNNTVAGIVGWPNCENPVENVTYECDNSGTITLLGTGKVRAAGIQGGTGNIEKCKNTGTVIAKSTSPTSTLGGIAAFHSQNHTLSECENTGSVISEAAIAGVGGLIGNNGNAANSTGEACAVNCKIRNVDADGKRTGMIVGFWNGKTQTVNLGSLSAPIRMDGSISLGAEETVIDDNNFEKWVCGTDNASDLHVITTSRHIVTPGKVEGYVKFDDGTAASGISVSDGFTVVSTDSKGYYEFQTRVDSRYIYISVPSDVKIGRNANGSPDFFQRYSSASSRYDFTLVREPEEEKFAIVAMADPQAHYTARSPQTIADVERFRTETVPALNGQVSSLGMPAYGITLGDVVYSEGSRNSNPGFATMRSNFDGLVFPVFQTMGNHDYTYFNSSAPLTPDATASTVYIKAQRGFENCFGPVNYSFNRGKVHFVCMRNVNYDSTTDASSYHGGFTDDQYAWLSEDLKYVASDCAVVLCVHIPVVGLSGKQNVTNVLNLLKKFPNSRVFSGHTHYKRGVPDVLSSGMYEHVHSAVCGQWWWSNVEGDGCPNGYTVYTFEGNRIVDEFFCGVNSHMNTRDYQMRLYRGNAKCGGPYAYFQWPHADNVLLINLFNGDSRWTVNVYEDGVFSGTASVMPFSKKTWSSVTKGQTYTVTEASSQDWWAIGFNIGVLGRGTSSTSYYTGNYHMFKYSLKNSAAKVRVEAVDPYGTIYTCSDVISDGTAYPEYVKVGNH